MTNPEKNSEEYSKRLKRASERHDIYCNSEKLAGELWKRLVKNVGGSKAKEIMRHVMGGKKPGPPPTDEDIALNLFIYGYLLHWGLDQTDGQIAKRIFESKPRYLQLDSGTVVVANDAEFSETYLCSSDDPIVGRRPIDMKRKTIQKRVERIRRWTIEEDALPKAYAPRPYHRD